MKNANHKLILQSFAKLTLYFVVLTVTSCTKSNSVGGINISASQTKSIIQNGSWKVSYFFDSGDETYKFSGYNFTFNATGAVAAIKSSTTINGTWSSGNDDSQVKFVLDFNGVSPFNDIEDDWHVISQTNSEVKLIDVSGGNGGTDYLTFSKN
ncbi:MAG: hypothetical protein IPI46_08725 [Bacteroidetes bacterium]|nr:hypothetical protein [Bacteroidota bacterium]